MIIGNVEAFTRTKRRINSKLIAKLALFIVSLFVVFVVPSSITLSVLILFISSILLLKYKSNAYLLTLFGIIFYINISSVFSEIFGMFISLGNDTLSWQSVIRESEYWLIGAKSMVLMLSTFNLCFTEKVLDIPTSKYSFDGRENSLVFYFGYILLWVIWLFFGYSSSSGGTYTSDTSTLYEYCLIICPIVWLYSNKSISHKALIVLFCFAYCLKSFGHGDRSSMIPMALFLFLIFFGRKNIKLRHIIILAVLGLLVANVVSIFRINSFTSLESFFSNYFAKYGKSFLTSDTVSQSYYTSVVTQLTANDIGNGWQYFPDFLGAIIFGGGFKNGNVSNIVIQHYTNKYGGFYYSWPYFWFGYFGVVLFSGLLAYIIGKVFTRNSRYSNILKIVIVVFSFRWYLYTCFDFYRGCLFVSTIIYFSFYILAEITSLRKTKKSCYEYSFY